MSFLRMLWCMLMHDWSKQTYPESPYLWAANYCNDCKAFVVDKWGPK